MIPYLKIRRFLESKICTFYPFHALIVIKCCNIMSKSTQKDLQRLNVTFIWYMKGGARRIVGILDHRKRSPKTLYLFVWIVWQLQVVICPHIKIITIIFDVKAEKLIFAVHRNLDWAKIPRIRGLFSKFCKMKFSEKISTDDVQFYQTICLWY